MLCVSLFLVESILYQFRSADSTDNETKFREFVRFFHDWVMGKVGGLTSFERMHFQPMAQSSCVKAGDELKCFRPDFVGHIETFLNDTALMISKLPKLAATWDGHLERTNEGKKSKIEQGTIMKYKEEMLLLCNVYWNDFQCGHYAKQIPAECIEANRRWWHQPPYCIDLNHRAVRWPDHRSLT